MRRDAKERAMVPAGIETTHVKVPVIVSHNEQIRLDRLSAASAKLPQQLSISRKATFTRVDTRRRENRETVRAAQSAH